jgi:RNA polymerase sigma factor (sigma-70 family)
MPSADSGDPLTGTQHAFVTLLFTRYRSALHRYVSRFVPRHEADELVQETYFRLLRHGETVELEAMARALLFRTATNLLRDRHRRRVARQAEHHVPLHEHDPSDERPGPESQIQGGQVLDIIERTIDQMPLDMRRVFVMCRFRDMSYPDIAALLHVSPRTVARKMAEAMERLGQALEQMP